MKKTIVKFTRAWSRYRKDDIAGFDAATADKLVAGKTPVAVLYDGAAQPDNDEADLAKRSADLDKREAELIAREQKLADDEAGGSSKKDAAKAKGEPPKQVTA